MPSAEDFYEKPVESDIGSLWKLNSTELIEVINKYEKYI